MGKNIYVDLFNRGKEYWSNDSGNDKYEAPKNMEASQQVISHNINDLDALQKLIPPKKQIEFPFEVERNADGSFKRIPETSAEELHNFSKIHPPLDGETFGDYWDRLGTQKSETQEGADSLKVDKRVQSLKKKESNNDD